MAKVVHRGKFIATSADLNIQNSKLIFQLEKLEKRRSQTQIKKKQNNKGQKGNEWQKRKQNKRLVLSKDQQNDEILTK